MGREKESLSYPVVRRGQLPPLIILALLAGLLTPLLFQVLFLGYDPPRGWTGALLAGAVVSILFGFLFWLGRISSRQHVTIRLDGLLAVVPLRRRILFNEIESVTRAYYSKPTWEYGWSTFLRRKLIPAWDEPPNVEIRFKEPVRLNLYPFKWFRMLVLTIDQPDKFVEELSREIGDVHWA